MSAEENMALVRRFLKAHVKGDLDEMDEMMAPDYVRHTKLLPPSSDSSTNTLVIRPGRRRKFTLPT